MKAISIRQPWCSLIAHGIKDIENRTWACPKKYIGQRVLIHAGKSKPTNNWGVLSKHQRNVAANSPMFGTGISELPFGAIIGSVEIADCVQNHPSIWAEQGAYNWVLANPILFNEPIPAKGKLSFWDFDRIKEVKIECPECGSIEIAIEDYTTVPFPTYLHSCNNCGHVIMESEWDVIKKEE